ncbi:MAG: ATPase, partial [Clostridia bacterium]|nr:ATPase [Clostridia bacterium]
MSVRSVKAISIIGMMSELDKVVDFCGESEVFQPDDAMSFYSDTKNFLPLSTKNPYSAPMQQLKNSADLAGFKLEYTESDHKNISTDETIEYIAYFVSETESMVNKKLKLEQDIDSCKRTLEQVEHFAGCDIDFSQINDCRFITPNFGRIPKESYEKLSLFSDNQFALFFPFTNDETHYWGAYFTIPEQKDDIDRIFSSLYFERLEIPPISGTPDDYMKELQKELEDHQKELEDINKEIDSFWKKEKDNCLMHYSKLEEMDAFNEIKRHVYKYHKNFILVGWIPADKEKYFTKELDKIKSIEYSLSDGKDELKHSPPVMLKNPPFFRLYEFYVKMYGMPCYNETDPTIFVAITYTIFFGIMFGDMGQGFIVALVGALMYKFKKMEIGKILIPCGIAGMIFGFLYGSVFGFEEVLTPVHQALFGTKGKLIEVMKPDSINFIIYGSVVIGFVTIVFAMLTNIFSSLRRRDMESALFGANGVAGFIFYVSLVVGLASQMFLKIPLMNGVYVACLVILPLILMFLREPLGRLAEGRKNWQPEKWGEYCVQSFFELFEMCLSYVTN